MLKLSQKEYDEIHNDYKSSLQSDFEFKGINYKGSKTLMKWIEGSGTVLLIENIGFEITETIINPFKNNRLKNGIKQFTKKQADLIYDSGEINRISDIDILKFQIFQTLLCVEFERFKNAIKNVLLLEPNPWNLDFEILRKRFELMKFKIPTDDFYINILSEKLKTKL